MTKKEKWKKKTFTNYFRQGFLLVEDNVMSKITFPKCRKIRHKNSAILLQQEQVVVMFPIFRHMTHLYSSFVTNCLPCTIQNLALSSVRVDFTPPCMTRLWLSWTIRDVMWWPLSNKIGYLLEVVNSASAKRPVHLMMPW